MKKKFTELLSLVLIAVLLFAFSACGKEKTSDDLWKDAVYTEDTTLGSGGKNVLIDVTAGDKTVRFTVKTDAETVGAALLENGLIAGDEGPYGLYVKVVNGITADFDTDGAYWAFNVNGELAMTGVDGTEIDESTVYSLVRTK